MLEKTNRLIKIVEFIAKHKLLLNLDDKQSNKQTSKATQNLLLDNCVAAAKFSKVDLLSKTVTEFPNLQGILGSYCLQNANFDESIATAVRQHYLPLGPNSKIPDTLNGKFLAIADKIDTIIGLHSLDIKTKGSGDQFGLRRAAFGIIRILAACPLNIPISQLINFVTDIYLQAFKGNEILKKEEIINITKKLFLERVIYYLRQHQLELNFINSISSTFYNQPLFNIVEKVKTITKFFSLTDNQNLISAYKRACNILKQNFSQEFLSITLAGIKLDCLKTDIELSLHQSLVNSKLPDCQSNSHIDHAQLHQNLVELNKKAILINNLLDNLEVNHNQEYIKNNRLRLLQMFCQQANNVLETNKI